MEKFIEETSVPTVTIFNQDESNHPFLVKSFDSPNAKAMLFLNFNSKLIDAFKSKYNDVVVLYKGKGLCFLLGDLEASQGAFQTSDNQKYLKSNVEPDHIAPRLKEYIDGKLKSYVKSDPFPEVNNEPMKVIVRDSLQDFVFNSGKMVVNLIPFNPIGALSHFGTSSEQRITRFQKVLRSNYDVQTTVRKQMGQDIRGACGQLVVN